MTDLVTVLKHCQSDFQLANQLLGEGYHGFVLTPREVDEALTALTIPFDPSKADGWVSFSQHDWANGRWMLERLGQKNGKDLWSLDLETDTYPAYIGHIHTMAFFYDLCENLNIKR